MNRIALGTVQFGMPYGISNNVGRISQNEARSILQLSAENGIDTLDTAIAYGESETCLGESGINDFKVITKLPKLSHENLDVGKWVMQQVDASLSRLGVKKIYGLLLHRPEDLLSSNGYVLYQAMKSLKEKGLVGKIGISIYSPNQLMTLTHIFRFDIVQAPFNLIDRRLSDSGWLGKLKDSGIELHTRSTFLQGLLLMRQEDIPPQFFRWNYLWKIWHQWLSHANISALQAALAFPFTFPEIDRIVVGVDSQNQLVQILTAIDSLPIADFPNLACEDQDLINPSNWTNL